MSGIDFRAVRRAVTLAQVLELLEFVPSETHGDQVRGPCLVHDSESLSSRAFSANLRKHTYRCFRCGSAGNQLDLWSAVTQQPLYPATIELCERLGVPIPRIDEQRR